MEFIFMFLNILYKEILQKLFYFGRYLVVYDAAGSPALNPNFIGFILLYIICLATRIMNRVEEKQLAELNAAHIRLSSLIDLYTDRTCSPCTDDTTIDKKSVASKNLKSTSASDYSRRTQKRRRNKFKKIEKSKPTAVLPVKNEVPSIIDAAKKEFGNRPWNGCLRRFISHDRKVNSLRVSSVIPNWELPVGCHTLKNLHGPLEGCNVCDKFRDHTVTQPTRRTYLLIALTHEATFRFDRMKFIQLCDYLENKGHQKNTFPETEV
jgi:hypothetical protein